MFFVHPLNVCDNVPFVGDDGDGFAVVVFESHLNHFVILCCCCLLLVLSARPVTRLVTLP